MRRNLFHRVLFGAAVFMTAAAGCGPGGPELADVEGTVTLDGQPVPNAIIRFSPRGHMGTTSAATTDEQGHYTLIFNRDREGAMPGSYNVMVTTEKLSPADVKLYRENGVEVSELFVAIPARYGTFEGGLTAEVKPDTQNRVDLKLTSK
jgi:hypothetical protein